MGYSKIVQYGNVNELYLYEKPYIPKSNQNHLKLQKLLCPSSKLVDKKKENTHTPSKKTFIFTKTDATKKRTLKNFYRLCHHNNYHSQSIHFITLTFAYDISYKEASRALSKFMERIQKITPQIPIRYISVPEVTKKGRYHFHLLVYDLPTSTAGDTISIRRYNRKKRKHKILLGTTERFTRNLQMHFHWGYIDIMPTTYKSSGIAGYMAKYMAKAFDNPHFEAKRLYNTSRNIKKVTSYGSNTLDKFTTSILPTVNILEKKEIQYNTPYMGKCRMTRVTTINK